MERRRIVLVASSVAIILSMIGLYQFTRSRAPASQPEGGITLKVITRHSSTIWLLTRRSFLNSSAAMEHNITDIQFMAPNAKLWIDTVKASADIDLGWGGGASLANDLVEEGLVALITDPELLEAISQLPEDIGGMPLKARDEGGRPLWCASALSSFGFIINYPILQGYGLSAPSTWEDLASPELAALLPKPVISYARPTASGSHTRIYQIILQMSGWDEGWALLARLAANGRPYSGSVEALTAVQTGEVPVGIAIDFYGYSSQVEFPGTRYVIPFNESIVGGDPIELLTTSTHPEAAQAFMRWLLSVEGQKIWLNEKVNRMPIREDVFWTEEGRGRPDLYENYNETLRNVGIAFDEEEAEAVYYSVQLYFDSVYSDLHDGLSRTWKALVDAHNDGRLTNQQFQELVFEMGRPLTWAKDGIEREFTLQYAASINERIRGDRAFAAGMGSLWRRDASQRYKDLLGKVPPS